MRASLALCNHSVPFPHSAFTNPTASLSFTLFHDRSIISACCDCASCLTFFLHKPLGSSLTAQTRKRSLALREFALGIESLERFVRNEPLRRVHEAVFGVLALESEPVDPRL